MGNAKLSVHKVWPASGGIDLAHAFQLAPIGLAVLDREFRFICCNDALAEINGLTVEQHLGRSAFDIIPDLAAEVEADFRRVFETGEPLRDRIVRGKTPSRSDENRVWLECVMPLPSSSGAVEHILVSVKEITELERTRRALAESENQFRVAQQLSPDAYTVYSAVRDEAGQIVDFLFEYANPAAEAIAGRPLTGTKLLTSFPASASNDNLFPRYARLVEEHSSDVVEVYYEGENGFRWHRNSAVAIGGDRIAISYKDITARKLLEEKLHVVAGEYRHRLKNAFTVMTALTRQSAKSATDVQSLAEDICGRMLAMSTAQDIIARDRGAGSLAQLVSEILAPFAGPQLDMLPGPEVEVPNEGVVALGLALNELATNAIKFGALSERTGRVSLGWSVEGDVVRLEWLERGGPLVSEPQREGFGTRLIKDVERRLPKGSVSRQFDPEGLTVQICFEVDQL